MSQMCSLKVFPIWPFKQNTGMLDMSQQANKASTQKEGEAGESQFKASLVQDNQGFYTEKPCV